MTFDPKVIEALARLRHAAHGIVGLTSPLARDINTLDNAGVFAALDEQTDYAAAEEILAESALRASADDRFEFEHNEPDPAEWADTTRHPGYVAASRLGKLERVPGTDMLRPVPETEAQEIRRLGDEEVDRYLHEESLDATATFGPRDVWSERARAVEDIRPKGRKPGTD